MRLWPQTPEGCQPPFEAVIVQHLAGSGIHEATCVAMPDTGEAPLSATGFGVDFLPPFWGHLKQPVLLQGSWWRLGFLKWIVDATVCVCYSSARCVAPDRDVASNSPAVAVGGAVARKAFALCALGCSPYNARNRGAQSRNAVYVHPYFPLTLWRIPLFSAKARKGSYGLVYKQI